MELVFSCPETDRIFYSKEFDITDNRGIRMDSDGNKSLDAWVVLTKPCPFCGKKHAYHAGELACPLTTSKPGQS